MIDWIYDTHAAATYPFSLFFFALISVFYFTVFIRIYKIHAVSDNL